MHAAPTDPQAASPSRAYRKIPFVCVRVVKASHELTLIEKLIYEEHYGLCKGRQGARISALEVGHRLHVGRASVERARDKLKSCGLFAKRDFPGSTDEWFAVFPIRVPPLRLNADGLDRYLELLDQHITSLTRDGGPRPPENDDYEPPSPHDGGLSTTAPYGAALRVRRSDGGPPSQL